MKKFLLSLAVLAFGANVMMAEDPIASISFEKNSSAYGNISSYATEWKSADNMWIFYGFNNNNRGWDFIAAGSKKADTNAYVASGGACPLPVSSLVFNIGDRYDAAQITSAKLIIADNADFTSATESILSLPTGVNTEWVVNVESPAANKFYKVELTIPQTSDNGKAISFTKIALYQNAYTPGENPVDPEPDPIIPAEGDDFALAKTLTDGGRYALVADGKAGLLFTQAYGYMKTSAVSISDDKFKFDGVNAITISKVDGAETYTLRDSKKMYLGMDTEHKNTFQLNAAAGEGYQWTVEIAGDGMATITNTLTGRQVMMDPQYGSFGVYMDDEVKETYLMPYLYITDAEAPVVPDPVDPTPDPEPTPSDTIDLDVAKATAIVGEEHEETLKADGSVQAAKHVQPLESLEIDGYIFTFASGTNTSNAPAYYWPTSTSTNGKESIRIYAGNTMTVIAPAGKEFTTITSIPDNSTKETKIYAGASTLTCTFTATENTRINLLKFGTGEVEEPTPTPTPADGDDFALAKTLTNGGSYALVADSKAGVLFTKAYGYMSTSAVTIADDKFKFDGANAITISAVEGTETYTLKDSKDMYLGMDTEHKNTFQLNATAGEGYQWTVDIASDGMATITNTLTGRQVMMDPQYGSFGVYMDDEVKETYQMPYLYVLTKGGSSVAEIEVAEDGEAVYYNLQGIKIDNPEKGLYIRVQGKKASKVIL